MKVKEFLEKVAYKTTWKDDWMEEPSEIYVSKFDGSFITFVGLEDDVKFLAEHEITEELTHGVGFSPKENKWYGWSHRAICGFTIGSECKKGDVHYTPLGRGELVAKTMEDAKQMAIDFCRGIS